MKRILIYGDSNSFGTAPISQVGQESAHPRGARWGDQMAGHLGDGYEVIVEGLPGRTTVLDDPIDGPHRNGRRVLPAILHSHKPIDLLIICLGTNDMQARYGFSGQDSARGVARLVRDAADSRTVARTLVICPPPPREVGTFATSFAGAENRIGDMAGALATFAGPEGAEIFDAGRVIEVDPIDGVHWSIDSHATLGRAVADVVRTLL